METNQLSNSPYIGLQPYSAKDQKYFFGRDRDSRIISSNLFAANLTVLYGASGVGKSSVLQAGVIPLLRKSPRTAVIAFQRWPEKNPVQILKEECLNAIHAAGYKDISVDTSLPFDEFLFQASNAFHGTILIILDQFEEYFLYHREAENTFDAELALAVNREDIDANFLIALREDSLSMLDQFRTRIPNLLGNSLRLRHLDEGSAREAICKPLEVYNQEHSDKPQVSMEEQLVDVLIKDVQAGKLTIGQGGQGGQGGAADRGGTPDSDIRIETPFLQLVLTRLWDKEIQQGSSVLQLQTLTDLGGAKQIVRTHLDHVMNDLPPEYQEIASNIFRFLVTPSGTKIAYTVEDLASYYAESTNTVESTGTLVPVLNKLVEGNVRVLRQVSLPGEPSRYEIYHDVLASAILDWRTRYRKGKELNQELAKQLAEELAKARAITWKQIKTLLKWGFWGGFVDIIWMIIGGVAGAFTGGILLVLLIIPVGGFAFRPGLRKITPLLNKKQINKIILWWGVARVVILIIAYIIIVMSDYIESPVTTGILIGIAVIGFLNSGPIGGILAYWQIRRKEGQLPAATAPQPTLVASSS